MFSFAEERVIESSLGRVASEIHKEASPSLFMYTFPFSKLSELIIVLLEFLNIGL